MKDYLNRLHLRNEENTDRIDYNCGGYALGTYSWYVPGNENDYEDTVEEFISDYVTYNRDIIINNFKIFEEDLFNFCIDQILYNFSNLKRVSIKEVEEMPENIEIIAFRTSIDEDTIDYDTIDYDFHFKLRKNGNWTHKRGDGEISPCSLKDWSYEFINYNSPTAYFIWLDK